MADKYRMSKVIWRYYLNWIHRIHGPGLLDNRFGRDRFYIFVSACIRYSRQELQREWLRYFLDRDLQGRYSDAQVREQLIDEVLNLFGHILTFTKVSRASFPDPLVEMKNPYAVKAQLQRYSYIDRNGKRTPLYSRNEIEEILIRDFGPDWRDYYRNKYGVPFP